MFKFEIWDIVYLKPNFMELWKENNRRLPLDKACEHHKVLIGKGLKNTYLQEEFRNE